MIGDNPSIVHKPKHESKSSWTEKALLNWFNKHYEGQMELMACNQDYQTFDYWMTDLVNPSKMPRIVELKCHPNKKSTDRELVGCDFVKLQKLRGLSVGTKAYIFHLFEDIVIIQDVDVQATNFIKTTWNFTQILLALVYAKDCAKRLPVGLVDLRLLQG